MLSSWSAGIVSSDGSPVIGTVITSVSLNAHAAVDVLPQCHDLGGVADRRGDPGGDESAEGHQGDAEDPQVGPALRFGGAWSGQCRSPVSSRCDRWVVVIERLPRCAVYMRRRRDPDWVACSARMGRLGPLTVGMLCVGGGDREHMDTGDWEQIEFTTRQLALIQETTDEPAPAAGLCRGNALVIALVGTGDGSAIGNFLVPLCPADFVACEDQPCAEDEAAWHLTTKARRLVYRLVNKAGFTA